MKEKFIFWAQALDNTSPDHFYARGDELSVDDSARRQEAVSLVSSVIKNGKHVYEDGGVLLTADAHHFVIECPSAQRDRAGRIAPIVCYGEYNSAVGDELVTSVPVALEHFAKRIGRTVQPDHLKLVDTAFKYLVEKKSPYKRVDRFLKKKISTTKIERIMIGAGALTLLAAALYWMTQRNG